MSRRVQLAAAAALGTIALVATALAFAVAGSAIASSTATAAARGTKIELRRTDLGKILVNSRGLTLYAFSADGRRLDRCAAMSNCPQQWPLVTTHGRPRAGHGVKRSLLGTIKVGGKTQVTYAGHPLYTYSGDSPGSTSYVGFSAFSGVWRAVTAAGKTRG